jgi:uncharacterized heparinase superfamily protein
MIAHFSDGSLDLPIKTQELLQAVERYGGQHLAARQNFFLTDSGYAGIRNEAGDCLIYDYGQPVEPSLPAHGHADIFSFEWSIGGKRFVIDPGVFEYSASPIRDANRSSLYHNTLSIAGQSQCEMYSSFRVGRRAKVNVLREQLGPEELIIDAEHTGYQHLAGAPRHRRVLRYTENVLEITDTVIGGSDQSAELYFLLHPDVDLTPEMDLRLGAVTVKLHSSAEIRSEAATWYPAFGKQVPTRAIRIKLGAIPVESTTIFEITSR